MRKIAPGQLLRFVSQNDSCLTRVLAVREYTSFEDLLDTENIDKINPGKPKAEQLAELRQIFPRDKEALGVLAIELTNDVAIST
jgi:ASC-1-like (ASCH) protein